LAIGIFPKEMKVSVGAPLIKQSVMVVSKVDEKAWFLWVGERPGSIVSDSSKVKSYPRARFKAQATGAISAIPVGSAPAGLPIPSDPLNCRDTAAPE
jgi:hypothetical protein